MKTYEIKVSAAYEEAGTKHYNAFKEYVRANTAAEARKSLTKDLKAECYINIKLTDTIPV